MARSGQRRIPSWVFEFFTLVLLTFVLRWWLKGGDRRVQSPVWPEATQVLRVAPGIDTTSPEKGLTSKPIQTKMDRLGKVSSADDLTRIRGIGPKVAQLLQSAGINSFAQLAEQNEASLRALLRKAGLPMINPADWPEQARLLITGAADDIGS